MTPVVDVSQRRKPVAKIKHVGLRIGTWNFQGLCSVRKASQIGEILSTNGMDILGGQENWELESSKFLCLVINGLANLGKELKSSKERVG